MALWRTRTLTPEQKEQIAKAQEDQDERSIMLEDAGSNLDAEDASRVDMQDQVWMLKMQIYPSFTMQNFLSM